MHGYTSPEQVIGQHLALVQVEADAKEVQENVEKLLNGEPIPAGKFTRRRQDSSIGYHTSSINSVVQGGKVIGLEGFLIDLTEWVRAEREVWQRNEELVALNAIASTISQPLDLDRMLHAILNKVLQMIDVDAGWIQLLDEDKGVLSLAAQRGFSQETVKELQIIKLGEGITGTVAQSGQPTVVYDVAHTPWLNMETIQPRGLHALASVPIESKDQLLGVLSVFSYTPGKQTPQKVQLLSAISHQVGVAVENARLAEQASSVEILQELNRLRSELIANVSHEVRTPLGLIKVSCSSLLAEDVDFGREIRRKFLRSIDEETVKLEKIVDNLLNLSQIESGRLRLDKHPTDVAQLTREVTRRLETQTTQHHFVHDLPPNPLMAVVDARRVEQVLRNLLGNAIKYSPNGGAITIQGNEDENQLIFRVHDQGIGIPPKDLERVFERFYRVETETAQNVRGVGLGLAICQSIIGAHGGHIWVKSSPGEGSTFYFTLPIGDEPKTLSEQLMLNTNKETMYAQRQNPRSGSRRRA